MDIIRKQDGNEVVLEIVGWMDTQAAPKLEEEVNKLEAGESLVLDLSQMEYISSSGLRQFVAAHKKVKGNMVLRNVADNVKGLLKTTGLDKRITIE